jgi:hypothetical protein
MNLNHIHKILNFTVKLTQARHFTTKISRSYVSQLSRSQIKFEAAFLEARKKLL